jgi:hypothetical protein
MRRRRTVVVIVVICVAGLVLYLSARRGTYRPQSYGGNGSVVLDSGSPGRYSIRLPSIRLSEGQAAEPHFKIVNGPPIGCFVVVIEVAPENADKVTGADFNVEVLVYPAGVAFGEDSDLTRLVYMSNGPLSAWRLVDPDAGRARRYLPPSITKPGALRAGIDYEISINLNPLGASGGGASGGTFELTPLIVPTK